MSKVELQRFYEELGKNSQIRAELAALKEELPAGELLCHNASEFIERKLIPLAKKHGFEFSVQDYADYHAGHDDVLELSENDLMAVSGGVHLVKAVLAGMLGLTVSAMGAVAPLVRADDGKGSVAVSEPKSSARRSKTSTNSSAKSRRGQARGVENFPTEGQEVEPDPEQVLVPAAEIAGTVSTTEVRREPAAETIAGGNAVAVADVKEEGKEVATSSVTKPSKLRIRRRQARGVENAAEIRLEPAAGDNAVAGTKEEEQEVAPAPEQVLAPAAEVAGTREEAATKIGGLLYDFGTKGESTDIEELDGWAANAGDSTEERKAKLRFVLSAAGARGDDLIKERLISYIEKITDKDEELLAFVDKQVAEAPVGSALAGFRGYWQQLRSVPADVSAPVSADRLKIRELVKAVVQSKLEPEQGVPGEYASELRKWEFKVESIPPIEMSDFPQDVVMRKPHVCSLLDVAAGAGSERVFRHLLLNGAKVTVETWHMAIAGGNQKILEQVNGMLALDGIVKDNFVALAETAADFHNTDMFDYVLRVGQPDEFSRELIWRFVLERGLADAAQVLLRQGFRPWSARSGELLLQQWRDGKDIKLAPPPEGFNARQNGWAWSARLGELFLQQWRDGKDIELASPPKGFSTRQNGWAWTNGGRVFPLEAVAGEAFRIPAGIEPRVVTEVVVPYGITAIRASAFRDCLELRSVKIPASVTKIGEWAFEGCSGLTSVTIPAGVTTIGKWAFHGCSSLTSVMIPAGVTAVGEMALDGCSRLTSAPIPAGVKAIGEYAFYNCSSLTSVTIPAGVTDIGEKAFDGCSGLTSVTIPASVESMGECAFGCCIALRSVVIPASVTAIRKYVFVGCSGLTSVKIPAGVTTIGKGAFSGCSRLTSAPIPAGVTTIGENAFCNCSSLTSVTIPAGVTAVRKMAFGFCVGLTSVAIPAGVTTIGEDAFWDCRGLTSVAIPASVTTIEEGAFRGCRGLTSVEIPAGVTTIGKWAFKNCSGLTSVEIPESVEAIGEGAFSHCSGLTKVAIPAGVTTIGERAFENCGGLEFVEIPSGVTAIKSDAFAGCSGLTSVKIPAGVTEIGEGAFSHCSGLTKVAIPAGVWIIERNAFKACSGLTSVTISEGVGMIELEAFWGCSGLQSVTIPKSVKMIIMCAFEACSKLTSVRVNVGTYVVEDAFEKSCKIIRYH